MSDVIVTEDLIKRYEEGNVTALKNVNIQISENSITAVVGKSGCGKTTLLNLIGGLDSPTSGRVYIKNTEISKMKETKLSIFRARTIGFVFQFFNLIPELTALENILFPSVVNRWDIDKGYLNRLIEVLEIGDFSDRLPSQLSGGQQQRVAIARALLHKPAILLMDEPTGNLDEENSNRICELIRALKQELGRTILFVTHDKDMTRAADRIIRLRDGAVVSDEVCHED